MGGATNITPRYPFESEIAEQPEGVQNAHRYAYSGILDLNKAIGSLKAQIESHSTAISGISTTVYTTSGGAVSVAGVSSFNMLTGDVSFFPSLGIVNDQGAAASYTTQTSDNGALIVFTASPTVTLNSAIATPWFTTLSNQGAGTITITAAETINGATTVPAGGNAVVYWDGVQWWIDSSGTGGGGGTVFDEVPAGVGTAVITFTHTPLSVPNFTVNGVFQIPGGVDYTLVGAIAYMTVSTVVTDKLYAIYEY